MAYHIKATGEVTEVRPANGVEFTLAELQGFVGGYLEIVNSLRHGQHSIFGVELAIGDDSELWLNEEGKLQNLPINPIATMLYTHGKTDPIVGDVLLSKVAWRTNEEGESDDYHY